MWPREEGMSASSNGGPAPLPPDDAFAVLGNETRMDVLQTLGSADGPLSFSELRSRVGMRDSGQFNYHLEKLAGHFVHKDDDGYSLRQAGRAVVEAVLSGAITEDPVLEPAVIDFGCRLCGANIEVSYAEERVRLYCTNCPGLYATSPGSDIQANRSGYGYVGSLPLPPAGIKGRSAFEVMKAAITRGHLDFVSAANDICPKCSAVMDHSVAVCEAHHVEEGVCEVCGNRHAAHVDSHCTNCIYGIDGILLNHLIGSLELRRFVAEQGLDPIVDGEQWGWDFEEEIRSSDPFEAQYTITVGDEAITLTVGPDFSVVETERRESTSADR